MAIFGVLGLVVGLYLAFGRADWRLGEAMPTGLRRMVAAPVVGFLSVLMGIGGGSFGVPLMTLYNTPIHRAVATAAGFGVIIAVPSVLGFLMIGGDGPGRPPLTIGQVNLVAFVAVIAMTLLTTPLGVKLAHAMNPKPLKRAFAVFIMIMALNMLRKALGY
ncbi:Membrane protein [Roseibacterium elongatum DSM 19469]|uniref:Probable membrane transporter protein n=1 Tax=Roseicyclus elongatus DSM 19469 TaxID=1294273 RepID=W8S867_9RHOB|nr:Membrane protein [Roseibacterium elongatum DSM 19469]